MKALEIYNNRLVLYGCGDFLNDYEGIEGYESFRNDLSLMYFADIDAKSGDLVALEGSGANSGSGAYLQVNAPSEDRNPHAEH